MKAMKLVDIGLKKASVLSEKTLCWKTVQKAATPAGQVDKKTMLLFESVRGHNQLGKLFFVSSTFLLRAVCASSGQRCNITLFSFMRILFTITNVCPEDACIERRLGF